jgi:3-oxoacyl-[acyl-carrier-protein] synthase II
MQRVVITGAGALSPLGHDWPTVLAQLRALQNRVQCMGDWAVYEGLQGRLGVPVAPFDLPRHYHRKSMRSMGRVALLATRATELALIDAGLLGQALVTSGEMGIAYGSSMGSPADIGTFAQVIHRGNSAEGVSVNTYIKSMSHTAAVNIGVFFGITGRIITTSSACTSSSQAIGYAFETIQSGKQVAMLAGGCEELHPITAVVFDTQLAASLQNDTPHLSPRPFDAQRDGLVLGEGGCTLVLESLDHALARGARIYAEVLGFATNSDGRHVTQPNPDTMAECLRMALDNAAISPHQVGYINAHGTATEWGDIHESQATHAVMGAGKPVASLKSYMGHTLGASGALEAWMSVEMMREGWFAPNLNLAHIDPRCAPLNYLTGSGSVLQVDVVMSNNFAFGGINTSLIFRRWPEPGA